MAVFLLQASCSALPLESPGRSSPTEPLLILAASDLQFALPEIVADYEKATRRPVTVSFGSTGSLSQQIANGAPADLLFAADESFLADLESKGLVVEGTRQPYAVGRLVLVAARSVTLRPATLQDLLRPEVKSIAIANPEHAPYGRAARQALQSSGIWDVVQPKLVLAENISQTFQFVQTGNADAGLVALSVALGSPGTPYALVDPALYSPLRQVAAVLTASCQSEVARDFLVFLDGPGGRQTMIKFGFVLPAVK